MIGMAEDFTKYDIKPEGFLNYLRYYGPHFNKKLCDFACQNMARKDYTKERLEALLQQHNIEIKNSKLYDSVYVANWCKSIFYGFSISNEKYFVLFIKDVFKKKGDLVFNKRYVNMIKKGILIDQEEMI